MQGAFYGPLGTRTVPESQRWFATPDRLPHYAERIGELKSKGAELIVIFGIGRVCHIAFWEPHFAGGVRHASRNGRRRRIASARGCTPDDRAERADQLQEPDDPGPRLRQHDRPRPVPPGGPDHRRRRGVFDRGMQWQGASLWMTLRYGPDPWVPSSFMPTLPGRLFYHTGLAGPLEPEMN